MTGNWKFKCALAGLLLAVLFTGYRACRSLQEVGPAWLRLERRHGSSLPTAMMPSLQSLLHQLELEVQQSGEPVESLVYFVILKTGKQMLVCNLETVSNPGFEPASQFPVQRWTTDQSIVGYYLLNGTPLNFTLKHHPTQPNAACLAVETREPLAPGASISVLRVEQRQLKLRPDAAGFCRQNLPWVPRDNGAIHAVAICLPARAILQTYQPAAGAYCLTTDAPFVGWINRRLDNNAPAPFVMFKLN